MSEGLPTPPKPALKLTPKQGAPVKPGDGAPKFRVTRSPFAPKVKPTDGTPAPMPAAAVRHQVLPLFLVQLLHLPHQFQPLLPQLPFQQFLRLLR